MLKLREQNAKAVPTNELYKRDLAWGHFTMSEGHRMGGRPEAATEHMRKARASLRRCWHPTREMPASSGSWDGRPSGWATS